MTTGSRQTETDNLQLKLVKSSNLPKTGGVNQWGAICDYVTIIIVLKTP